MYMCVTVLPVCLYLCYVYVCYSTPIKRRLRALVDSDSDVCLVNGDQSDADSQSPTSAKRRRKDGHAGSDDSGSGSDSSPSDSGDDFVPEKKAVRRKRVRAPSDESSASDDSSVIIDEDDDVDDEDDDGEGGGKKKKDKTVCEHFVHSFKHVCSRIFYNGSYCISQQDFFTRSHSLHFLSQFSVKSIHNYKRS